MPTPFDAFSSSIAHLRHISQIHLFFHSTPYKAWKLPVVHASNQLEKRDDYGVAAESVSLANEP